MTNLDFLCMQAAQAMARVPGEKNAKENVATKALGVLLENGPYGMVLHLQRQDAIAEEYRRQLLEMLKHGELQTYFSPPPGNSDFSAVTTWLQDLASNLDRYLFLKRLWQQTLTYTRYHAKASGEDSEPQK